MQSTTAAASHSAVEAVYRAQGDRIWRAIWAFAHDPDVASDAVAEAFAQALARGSAIRSPAGWVWRAAFRIAGGMLQQRSRTVNLDRRGSYEMTDLNGELIWALQQLPRHQRAAVPANGANCAPTIDETHYHTVKVRTEQPAKRGKTGIWVVTDFQDSQPFVQTAPPSEANVRRLMDAYLTARVAGTGAEKYVGTIGSDTTVHLDLYATSGGSRYKRFEITSLSGPEWPTGLFSLVVLLTAQDGSAVEESTYGIDAESVRRSVVNAFYFRARATGSP